MLSPVRLLGYGVSPPKPNFLSRFTSVVVEPKRSEYSGTTRKSPLRTIQEMNETNQKSTTHLPDINKDKEKK